MSDYITNFRFTRKFRFDFGQSFVATSVMKTVIITLLFALGVNKKYLKFLLILEILSRSLLSLLKL